MIVNPQFFNYRLIIGSLVIAIVVLGSYSFSSYNALKNHQEFLEQESKLVQNELSEMISHYDEMVIDNEIINSQLLASKSRMEIILDSVRHLKANVSLISKLKSQMTSLKKERNNLLNLVTAFEVENQDLKDKTNLINKKLASQTSYLQVLKEKNATLTETLKKVEALSLLNINVETLKTNSSKSVILTKKANQVDHLEVCFTLDKNEFAPKGNKNLYVQILDPKGNVLADKGSINFDDTSLVYSGKTKVYYSNKTIDVCIKMNVNSKKKLSKGTYFVSIFHADQRLGGKEIYLN